MKKYLIIMLFAASVSLACSCNSSTSQAQAEATELQDDLITRNVSVNEFQQLIEEKNNAILLDVRTPNEVAQGIIENANKIDFYDENFKAKLDELDKSKPVLVYCRSGRRSAIAMSTMRELGFKEVYNLQSGIIGWAEAGLELSK